MTSSDDRLSAAEAQALTSRINSGEHGLVAEAHQGAVHLALGYRTFAAYAAAELAIVPSPAERNELRREFRTAGMSPRSITAVLGPARSQSGNTRARVEEYQRLAAEHPKWRDVEFIAWLGVTKQVVWRLGLYASSPPEIQEAFYAGQIPSSVIEIVVGSAEAQHPYIRDIDRTNVVRKIIAGLVPTSKPKLRELMRLLTELRFGLRERWLDPAEAMSYTDLVLALHDNSAERAAAAQEAREREQKHRAATYDFDRILRSEQATKWLPKVERDLAILVSQMEEVLASEAYWKVSSTMTVATRLRQIGEKFNAAADYAEALQLQAARRREPMPEITIEDDGVVVITGVVM